MSSRNGHAREREERLERLALAAERATRLAHTATQEILDEVRFVEDIAERRRIKQSHTPERRHD